MSREPEEIFVGVDLHRPRWHVTAKDTDEDLFSAWIPGGWEVLRRLLSRYEGNRIHVVYEAGYFGFWCYDRVADYGVECIVTPPIWCPRNMGMG